MVALTGAGSGLRFTHSLILLKHFSFIYDSYDFYTQGCIGALDETYINVRVPVADAPRCRNRKGHITTNTLAACDPQLRFIYLLPGWEGSAGDSRILRDAVSRPLGLKVPKGDIF